MRLSPCRLHCHLTPPPDGWDKLSYSRRENYPTNLAALVRRAARALVFTAHVNGSLIFRLLFFVSGEFFCPRREKCRMLCSARLSRTRHIRSSLYFCHVRQWPLLTESFFHPRRKNLPGVLFYMRLPCKSAQMGPGRILNSRRKNLPGVLCAFGLQTFYGRILNLFIVRRDARWTDIEIPGGKIYPACYVRLPRASLLVGYSIY